jgi:predicted GNAT family acetyltransferase
MDEVEVGDATEQHRWEARIGGALAGKAVYRRSDGVIEFVHIEVEPEFEGRGIGSALARTSLDAARREGLRVVASCPFYAGWIDKHPDYQDLLA